jgi:hypothetical protein
VVSSNKHTWTQPPEQHTSHHTDKQRGRVQRPPGIHGLPDEHSLTGQGDKLTYKYLLTACQVEMTPLTYNWKLVNMPSGLLSYRQLSVQKSARGHSEEAVGSRFEHRRALQ